MLRLLARLRSFLRGLRRPHALERDMDEEMRFHLDLHAERLVRERGLAPAEARRQARVAFGSRDRYKEEGRDARGLTGITGLSLDVKLGARMLAKHPGVTIVGTLAMAIGVGLGAAYLEVTNDVLRPTLPLDDGERIVGLRLWDPVENDPELRATWDFALWREQLASVRDLAAFRSIERNLGLEGGVAEPAYGAAMTASGFRVARVPALLGRTLIGADERAGAPEAIVLGHDLWRTRFGGDAGIVGKNVRLGTSPATVIGVMPEGFAFPVSHGFWVPLRVDPLAHGPLEGPAIQVFGRLAPGVSRGEARAELSALGLRAAADRPATHERLRPQIVRYTELFVGGESGGAPYLIGLLFVLLLLVLSSNVATMVFARTATREDEIAMRFALGAKRGRILAQFFVEALVLALLATALGLAVAAWGGRWFTAFFWDVTEGRTPFWLDEGLNPSTVVWALALAVLGALVAGVLPALKATGARLQARLRQTPGAGDSALRFGGLWSAVIVVQVAFAVLILPPAVVAVGSLTEPGYVDPGFPGDEYLSADLALNLERPADDALERFRASSEELERRLLAEPEVTRVTFATRLPVMNHPQPWVQVDSADGAPGRSTYIMPTAVDPEFFDAFDADIVAGRAFTGADARSDAKVVIVNEHFVQDLLGGRNAIGRRLRYTNRYGERAATGLPEDLGRERMREPGQWFEIVGVVGGLGMDTNKDPFWPGQGPGVYHPLTPAAMGSGGAYSVRMALHVRGDAASFAPRLREIAHAVDPALRLSDVLPLDRPVDRANRNERLLSRFAASVVGIVGLIALLISTAGVYSVLAFTVSRQTREIGIRIALGADRRRIVQGVFSRAMAQIGVGTLAGYLVWVYILADDLAVGDAMGLFAVTALVLAGVGLVACGVPVRRALRVEPVEAIRGVE